MTATPRPARLARMLLALGVQVFAVSFMSGCVVPVTPAFQDPPASQNYAPVFLNVDPEIGAVVTRSAFLVTVTDPNVGDDLYVRWIADYPPYSNNTRTLLPTTKVTHSADGKPLSRDL